MKRKIITRLLLLVAFSLLLHSCVHDDLATAASGSASISSAEYTNKSLWKEDELYIKNVKQVYEDYADKAYFTSNFGTISWDHALTMGTFDESFLEVPVIKNGKVSFVLVVEREGDRVYFRRKEEKRSNDFFDILVFKDRNQLRGSSNIQSKGCITTEITWTWTNSDGSAGPVYIFTETKCLGPALPCQAMEIGANCGGSTGGSGVGGGFGNGGAGAGAPSLGYPYSQNPCAKLKYQNSTPDFKASLNLLETNLDLTKETGYIEKNDGSYHYKDVGSTNNDSNSLSLGNPTPDMKGYLHTHINDYTDDDGISRTGFKIFSPADVIYFNQMVALAQQNGISLSNIYAVMVSGTGNYEIRFTGNANQIKTVYANTKEQYNEMYKKYFADNKQNSNELNFLKFIDEQMYVKGISLIKINDDVTFENKTLNSTKTGVTTTPCP